MSDQDPHPESRDVVSEDEAIPNDNEEEHTAPARATTGTKNTSPAWTYFTQPQEYKDADTRTNT